MIARHLLLIALCAVTITEATLTCTATSPVVTAAWCNLNCNWAPPYCPPTMCSCSAVGSTPSATPTHTPSSHPTSSISLTPTISGTRPPSGTASPSPHPSVSLIALPSKSHTALAETLYVAQPTTITKLTVNTVSGTITATETCVTGLTDATGITVDASGGLYITDYGTAQLLYVASCGATPHVVIAAATPIVSIDVRILSDGQLIVASTAPAGVYFAALDGAHNLVWSSTTGASTYESTSIATCVDPAGHYGFLFAEEGNSLVYFDIKTHTRTVIIPPSSGVVDIAGIEVACDGVYFTAGGNNQLWQCTTTGVNLCAPAATSCSPICDVVPPGSCEYLGEPSGIAVDLQSNVFVGSRSVGNLVLYPSTNRSNPIVLSTAYPEVNDLALYESPECIAPGSCAPTSSLAVLTEGTNVMAYIPFSAWDQGSTGIAVVNIEGTGVTPTLMSTTDYISSCASNSATGETVCTANNQNVYLIKGSTITGVLATNGSGDTSFSGGSCTNCGVAIDGTNDRAIIALNLASGPGFQILNLDDNTFDTPITSGAGAISENILFDPVRNFVLSPSELNVFEIVDLSNPLEPQLYEYAVPGISGIFDSAAADCITGIAFAPAEFSNGVFVVDLTQATFTPGSPGTWSAPSQFQILSEAEDLSAGACSMAVIQGTHHGLVSGEFGGDLVTAVSVPTASGSGIPAISDWVSCSIGDGFGMGYDPHTLNAYRSPSSGHAIALLTDWNTGLPTRVAVVDIAKMLDPSYVPRTPAGHGCLNGTLPDTVRSFISIP